MTAPVYIVDGSPLRDPIFTAVISERMRVPDRLRVSQAATVGEDTKFRAEDLPAAFSMHVPDRLALTDAPDLSPRPLFSQHNTRGQAWGLQHGPRNKEANSPARIQSPLRRSNSDETFGRTSSGIPSHSRHSLSATGAGTMPAVSTDSPLPVCQDFGAIAPVPLTPQSLFQAARKLGKRASHRILQTVSQKYSSRFGFPEYPSPQPEADRADRAVKSSTQEFWCSPEEESGTTVEFIVLRRQMMKMSRRIASLEKQNAEHRQSELVLGSLLFSAFLINSWLWIRK